MNNRELCHASPLRVYCERWFHSPRTSTRCDDSQGPDTQPEGCPDLCPPCKKMACRLGIGGISASATSFIEGTLPILIDTMSAIMRPRYVIYLSLFEVEPVCWSQDEPAWANCIAQAGRYAFPPGRRCPLYGRTASPSMQLALCRNATLRRVMVFCRDRAAATRMPGLRQPAPALGKCGKCKY
jgi:hypothetical protein